MYSLLIKKQNSAFLPQDMNLEVLNPKLWYTWMGIRHFSQLLGRSCPGYTSGKKESQLIYYTICIKLIVLSLLMWLPRGYPVQRIHSEESLCSTCINNTRLCLNSYPCAHPNNLSKSCPLVYKAQEQREGKPQKKIILDTLIIKNICSSIKKNYINDVQYQPLRLLNSFN